MFSGKERNISGHQKLEAKISQVSFIGTND